MSIITDTDQPVRHLTPTPGSFGERDLSVCFTWLLQDGIARGRSSARAELLDLFSLDELADAMRRRGVTVELTPAEHAALVGDLTQMRP